MPAFTMQNSDSQPSFERVSEQNENAGRLSQIAEYIGCADIAAADRANIHTLGFARQVARWNRAEQICTERG